MTQDVQTPTTMPQADDNRRATPPNARGHARAVWVLLGAAIVLLLVAGLFSYYRFAYNERIYPGVQVGTVDVGALSASEALDMLVAARLDPELPVVLQVGDERWPLDPVHAGVVLDARASVADAYAVGRSGSPPAALYNMLRARLRGWTVTPSVVVSEQQALHTVHAVADVFDRPAENAALAISGTTVTPVESIVGRALNVTDAMSTIHDAAQRGDWPLDQLDLPFNTITPEVVSADAAVGAAGALLASPIALRDGSDSWPLAPEALVPMLTVTSSNGAVVLGLDEPRLAGWMEPVTETISRSARLPRFQFDQATGQLILKEQGLSQRRVDIAETARRVLAVGGTRPRAVPVAVDEVQPAVPDTVTAQELGIVDVVEEQTSQFAGSPAGRMHNIGLAAEQFNGLLVPPDAVFSFNEHVGDISPDTGYEETKIIMDGTTQDGVGGGVCQVSTTLFRTAFFSGMPIEERYPHGYRVAYYEQGAPPGLDATVYSPVVDFKFQNDTDAWLLVETETDVHAATLTFRFLGTRPDRQVTLEGPEIGGTTPPPEARVEIDPELAPGESKVLEYARDGASVRVTRVITAAGQELREIFSSHYRPTGLVTAIGPTPPTAAAPGQAAPPGQPSPVPPPGSGSPSP